MSPAPIAITGPRLPETVTEHLGLFTDLYELRMAQAYLAEDMLEDGVFSLFVRNLPERRNFLLACGLASLLECMERYRFASDDLEYLSSVGGFSDRFLVWLENFRFEGEISAVPEGTPVFAGEPLLEIVAPLPQAQLLETLVMNQMNFQTILASKAARVVHAAAGRTVVDFGLRRIPGIDAGIKAARAFHVAGVHATSNVLAGKLYGIPIAGTMAHSYIQAHDDELEAFRVFAREFPDTILLVDTYDTLDGVRNVIALARELGKDFHVRGVRLDSGDLGALACASRALLNEAGLDRVEIFASGGLSDVQIAELLRAGAPIDGFGVGTNMGVSADSPTLDMAYKLTAYAGEGRMKLSSGKRTLPGRKQIFREATDGVATRDILGRWDEELAGTPLIQPVMRGGQRTQAGHEPLDVARDRARDAITLLPGPIRSLEPADPPYPVALSPALAELERAVRARVEREAGS